MAGGVGSRLWPFSRNNHPKQFHDILGMGQSLLQMTVNRFAGICPTENIYIVSNDIYKDLIKEQLPQLQDDQILLEPIKRNTAPCVAYAAYKIALKDPQANMVVTPADQVILQEDNFREVISLALDATAQNDYLVTLGIKPTRPDTGYGYIQYLHEGNDAVKRVKTFAEKPDLENAKQFLASGDFVWNAGIFVWNVNAIIQSFEKYMPDLAEIFAETQNELFTSNEQEGIKKAYAVCKSESIDIGVMEQAGKEDNVRVILCDFDWSDLGTWKSLYENSTKDRYENVITGKVLTYDTQQCIIKTPEDKLVVVQGLENFIVAEFDGVLLICHKDKEQSVKEFVNEAKNLGTQFV
jgi:mannose-1-phosphate guanylyltransferase